MTAGRRLASLLIVCGLVTLPAVGLRLACVGNSCSQQASALPVPFCPLPSTLREEIAAGFRDGRSPDVLAVADGRTVAGGAPGTRASPWPSSSGETEVPIAFFGTGVRKGTLPAGTGLDRIAPTLADIIGFRRPHPEIRSGREIEAVANGQRPRLVIEVALLGVGASSIDSDPASWESMSGTGGSSTLNGSTGSLPIDPAATLTTIGTGAVPAQHGVTGRVIRGRSGRIVRAWGPGAPIPVLATLADDLDHATGEKTKVALIAPSMIDRGLIGGTWYLDHDEDDLLIGRPEVPATVSRLLRSGYGADEDPDVVAVALRGPLASMAETVGRLDRLMKDASIPTTFVVAGSGADLPAGEVKTSVTGEQVAQAVDARVGSEVVASLAVGGLFLDPAALLKADATSADVADLLRELEIPAGEQVFSQVFPSFSVEFARFC